MLVRREKTEEWVEEGNKAVGLRQPASLDHRRTQSRLHTEVYFEAVTNPILHFVNCTGCRRQVNRIVRTVPYNSIMQARPIKYNNLIHSHSGQLTCFRELPLPNAIPR